MKPTLFLKAVAIFALTSLIRCAPVENQLTEITQRDTVDENPYCVKFFEDTLLKGKLAVSCIQFNVCWPGKRAPLHAPH